VAFFYNRSMFTNALEVEKATLDLLNFSTNLDVTRWSYKNTSEFNDEYRANILAHINQFDLVFGPSDSDSLKALDKAYQNLPVPFLAPFITTGQGDYDHLTLISASPTDAERVNEAYRLFLQYTALHSVTCLYRDDPWGNGIVRNMRSAFHDTILIQSQPTPESSDTKKDDEIYKSFIKLSESQGAGVIVVALQKSESINEFLDVLSDKNLHSVIKYKPSIVLLNPPIFENGEDRSGGILLKHVQEFRLVYVEEHVNQPGLSNLDKQLAAHLDACRVLVATANAWPPNTSEPLGGSEANAYLQKFYRSEWGEIPPKAQLKDQLVTGYNRQKLHFTDHSLDVYEATWVNGRLVPKPVDDYFGGEWLPTLGYSVYFFLCHHRSLWSWPTLIPFFFICLGSLLYTVRYKAVRSVKQILSTHSFWMLFLMNFSITYVVWIISLRLGIIDDYNWLATLLLAGVCPTAASALGDLVKQVIPINVTGVLYIIEEVTGVLIDKISATDSEYRTFLHQFPDEKLKAKLYEVLFAEIASEPLRSYLCKDLLKQIDSVQQDANKQIATRVIYESFMLKVVGYISQDKNHVSTNLNRIFEINMDPSAPVDIGQPSPVQV